MANTFAFKLKASQSSHISSWEQNEIQHISQRDGGGKVRFVMLKHVEELSLNVPPPTGLPGPSLQ